MRLHEVAAVRHLQRRRSTRSAPSGALARGRRSQSSPRTRRSTPFAGEKLLHLVGDLVGGRPLLVPDVRQMAGEHHRRRLEAALVAAEHGNGRSCRPARTRRPRRRPPSGRRRRSRRASTPDPASDFAPTKIVGAAWPGWKPRATGTGRFIADVSKPRRAAMSRGRGQLGRRRLFRQHDPRVDEVDDAVAVAILEDDARLEEVRERGGDGGASARCWPAPESGTHARQRRGRGGGVACSHGRIYQYKTKGHRVIAMPPCSTGLAPPAFTAPCRNQTSEPVPLKGKRHARLFCFENRMIPWGEGRAGPDKFRGGSYKSVE